MGSIANPSSGGGGGGGATASGQSVAATSVPVVLASDQVGSLATQATVATLATQTTVASLLANTTVGSAAPAASRPVNLSNDFTVTGGSISAPAVNLDLLTNTSSGWYDAANFHSAAVQVVTGAGISAGVLTFEQTNDTTAAAAGNPCFVTDMATITATPATTLTLAASATKLFTVPLIARYFRVRVSTAVVGGSVQAIGVFSQLPWVTNALAVQQGTAASLLTTSVQPTAANLNATVVQATAASLNATVQPGNTVNTTAWLANPLTPAVTTTGDTGAKTATFNGATLTNATAKGATVVLNVGTVSGTTPTMVCKLQGSADSGTSWFDIPGATSASLTATGVYAVTLYPGIAAVAGVATTGTAATVSGVLNRTWRVVYTIGGTTPSFTLTNVQVNYLI